LKIYKGIVLADFHCPYQDKKLVSLYRKFIDEFKPDEIVLNGDVLNYASYSRHGKRDNETANENIGVDHTEAIITLDTLFGGFNIKNKIWIDGNHDENQDKFFTEFPDQYDEAIHRYNKLQLRKRGFKVILPYLKSYKSGKLNFTHGFRSGVNAVRTHLEKDYKANFVMGHIHRSDIATSYNIEENCIQGYSIGCSTKLDFKYARAKGSNHGFGIYYVLPNGNFQFYNMMIIGYKFIFEGQVWS